MKYNLSNFIKHSIVEMFSGIVLGELENEKLLIELKESVVLSNEDFAKKFFSSSEIRQEILELFETNNPIVSSIDRNMEYTPIGLNKSENPAVYDITTYKMKENQDYKKRGDNYYITSAGYNNIYKAVSENMVIVKKFQLREFIKKGMPKLVVSSGKLNAKVLLEGNEYDENMVHGLTYTLYGGNEKISSGLSNNLIILDDKLIQSDLIVFEGNLIINKKNCYEFWFMSDKEVSFEIDNETYKLNSNKKILLDEGLHKIKIIVENNMSSVLNIEFYMKANYVAKIKVDDELLLTNINNEILNCEKDNEKGIEVKLININKASRNKLDDFISEIEISYKINSDTSME